MSETVSVVMPCYNAAPFVAQAMESALAQEGVDVELVVVDDASTDGSRGEVSRVAAAHPGRVRTVFLETNGGGCRARNRGAAEASGAYLMFLDADDALGPGTLRALVDAVRDRPLAVGAAPWLHLRRVEGEWREAPASLPLPEDGADLFRAWLEGTSWAPTSSVLWRRDAYAAAGPWDEALTREQDDDLMLRAYARGVRLARAKGGTAYYRLHDGDAFSVTRGVKEDKLRSSMRVAEMAEREAAALGRADELRPLLGNLYHQLALRGFQQGHAALARECQRRGEALCGPRAVSPTPLGRALARVLGLERKERVAQALARLGVATAGRRRAMRLRGALAGAEPAAAPSTEPRASLERP